MMRRVFVYRCCCRLYIPLASYLVINICMCVCVRLYRKKNIGSREREGAIAQQTSSSSIRHHHDAIHMLQKSDDD
jgi:hypothetical protein